MKKRLIPIVLFLSLVGLGGLSLVSIHNLQGNARVINYTGVVRGATQRLVKEELKGRADDALIARLDGIMEELATGVGANRLIRLNDQAYQDLLASMEDQWQDVYKRQAYYQSRPCKELVGLAAAILDAYLAEHSGRA